MEQFKKYPSIEQFRNVIKKVRAGHDYKGKDAEEKAIYLHDSPYPTLSFRGTVKLHGTNAAIGIERGGNIFTQSRNRLLTTEVNSTNDNAGFANFIASIPKSVVSLLGDPFYDMLFYGEWCGGSIQRGVAISKLNKMFIIFSVKENDNWANHLLDAFPSFTDELNHNGIFLITQFPTVKITIDFEAPELSQNKLAEITKGVGDCCPVAKTFGVDGIGEGMVWKCITPGYESSDYWFKVKDERHQRSKVKTLAPVDIEKVSSIKEFTDNTVTENRLNQGLAYLKEMGLPFEMKSIGDFLRWVFNDILKEEADTLAGNGLSKKEIGSPVSRKAKEFYINKLNKDI